MTLIIRKKRHISSRKSQEFPQSMPIPHPWQMAQPYAAMTGLHALHQTQPCIFDLLLLPSLSSLLHGLGSPNEK
jgi:hypothetical protein